MKTQQRVIILITLIILLVPLVAAAGTTYTYYSEDTQVAGGSTTQCRGVNFVPSVTSTFYGVARFPGVTATTAYLYGNSTVITTSTNVSSDFFYFDNVTVHAGGNYTVFFNSGASTYTAYEYTTPTYPEIRVNGTTSLNYTSGRLQNACSGAITNDGVFYNLNRIVLVVPEVQNVTITAKDVYTNTTINTFTAMAVNATGYQFNGSTTTGTLNNWTINFLQNSTQLWNITITSTENGGYFSKTYLNYNVSATLAATLAQSVVTFMATEKVSENVIVNANFTTSYLTNGTHYMRAQAYNVTGTKSGYFNATQEFTIAALSTPLLTVENLTNAKLNITARNNVTFASITSLNTELVATSYSDFTWTESVSGGSQISLINGTYEVTVSAPGYAAQTKNITILGGLQTTNASFELYAENSVLFSVFNSTSFARVNSTGTTIQIVGPSTYINNTNASGQLFLSNITPGAYDITITATGFEIARYIITVGDGSFQVLDAYLEPLTSNSVVFTILNDDTSQPIQSVLTTVEKQINGTYYLTNAFYSDITGRFELAYQSGAVYRFTMSKDGFATKQFVLNPIIFTSYSVRLTQTESAALDVDMVGLSLYISPDNYQNGMQNNFSFTLASPLGQLQLINYSIIVSNNATILTNSSANAYGATLTSSVFIYNATWSDTVTLRYGYVDSDGLYHPFVRVYAIGNVSADSATFAGIRNNTFGLSLIARVIIIFLISGLLAGLGYVLGGPTVGIFMAILSLAYWGSVGFVTWWLIIPSLIVLCLIGMWSLK